MISGNLCSARTWKISIWIVVSKPPQRLWQDNLFKMKQLVLDLSTSQTEKRTKIYVNLGWKKDCKKRWKIKKIIFQQLFFDLLKLIFLAANILLPAKSSQISYNIELFDHFLLNNIPKFTSQTLPKRLLNQHLWSSSVVLLMENIHSYQHLWSS